MFGPNKGFRHVFGRASGRLLCRNCTNIHHAEFSPPKVEGVCDACGGELYRRDDDTEEVVAERLKIYHEQTAPLIAYYTERGLLVQVDGDRPVDEVTDGVVAALTAAVGGGT